MNVIFVAFLKYYWTDSLTKYISFVCADVTLELIGFRWTELKKKNHNFKKLHRKKSLL